MTNIKSRLNILIKRVKNIIKQVAVYLISLAIVIFIPISIFNFYYKDKIFPGISIAGIKLSGITGIKRQEALNVISKKISPPYKLDLIAKDKNFELSLNDINFSYDLQSTIDEAFFKYRKNNLSNLLIFRNILFIKSINLGLKFNYDQQKLDEYLEILSSQTTTPAQYPEAKLTDGKIVINIGSKGDLIDKERFIKDFEDRISFLNNLPLTVPFDTIDPTLNEEQTNLLKNRAEKLIGKQINLKFEDKNLIIKDEDLLTFLNPDKGFDLNKITKYINTNIASVINREPQNAIFSVENGKVVEFKPAKSGVRVKAEVLANSLLATLTNLESEDIISSDITVEADIANAKITNQEVNNLGINELLGKGASKFKGSIASRVYNISLASSKINGALIAPGQTFSFNDTVGDISLYSGYKQAYIIKDGKTILGDGGGVCQVSTTLFRAALNAGLPILERHPHSYRVSYYEQDSPPGLDATVYAPTSDLKILNNTPAHILIQSYVDETNKTLSFEIYGTRDSRIITLEKPKISSPTPPPDDLYTDDPTLPVGVIKQIEHKAWGAKVYFYYKIDNNGKIIFEKTFYSNYRPWQAVYLRGTGTSL